MDHELIAPFEKDIVGYCDPLSALPGSEIGFKLSAYNGAGMAAAEIVELISGDDRPHGTGLITRSVCQLPDIAVAHQKLTPGSYGRVESVPEVKQGTLTFSFYPTLLQAERRTLLCWADLEIAVSEAGVQLVWPDGLLFLPASLTVARWYDLQLSFGDQTGLSLRRQAYASGEADVQVAQSVDTPSQLRAGSLILAARAPGQDHFNGRLEALVVGNEEQVYLHLDFAQEIASQRVVDVSGNGLDGRLYQNPTRGVCGRHWDATVQRYEEAPEQYAAIHFHEDDLTDAGWSDSVRWTVPLDLKSGQYALKVRLRASTDFVPFFVRAQKSERNDVAFLVPTASYLAYANQRLGLTESPFGNPKIRFANDAFLMAHDDVGYSMYEHHKDFSGVHFSSRLRPILNLKPQVGTWAFNADTHITAWLHEINQPFDVLTDEDLHLEGEAALEGYRVVITGTHPEYYSTAMRSALEGWLANNGRLMYMGGNGFYWRVAFQEDNPAVMEVRRSEDGTRAWIANPGEYYHQFGGEYGGMWRRLGKPPNQLVGIGFAAQGFDGGTYFKVQPGALDPRVAFVLEGVDECVDGDTWGQFGNQGGGAAGEEIDRFDATLGSPAHAVVLASSENHRPGMLRVKEEFHMMEPPGNDPKVRADMVFFEVPGGGAVFSTGSISFAGSLAYNDYHNEIAQITGNVLRRFINAEHFHMPAHAGLSA